MSSFRPSWLAQDGEAASELRPPKLLVALLLCFGLIAGLVGGGIGSAIHDDRILPGVIFGTLWAAPHFLSALFCWYGGDRFWYALTQELGICGGILSAGALYILPRIGKLGGGPPAPMGSLLWVLAALLIGNVTIYFAARAEAARRNAVDRNDNLLYNLYRFFPLWYVIPVVMG